jgi:hypothetical protein
MVVKLFAPEKANDPIVVTELGIYIFNKLIQFKKALLPTFVTV